MYTNKALFPPTWGQNRYQCTFSPEMHPPSLLIYQLEQRFFEHSKQAVQGLQPDQLLRPLRLLPHFVISGVWQAAFSCVNIYNGISNITLSCFIPFSVSKLVPCRTKQLFMVKCTSAYFIMALHNCFFLLASGGIFVPVLFSPCIYLAVIAWLCFDGLWNGEQWPQFTRCPLLHFAEFCMQNSNSNVVLRMHSLCDVAFLYCLSLAYIIASPLFRRILRGRFNNPDR